MLKANRPTRPRPVRELMLVAALFLAYKLGRLLVSGDISRAYADAAYAWHLERTLGLPSEAGIQKLITSYDWLVHATDMYYAWVHFPVTGILLLWTYLCRPAYYRWARTTLATLTATGFVIEMLLPMAPPRLLPATRLVDTGHVFGPSPYGNPATNTLANQYAAMPSLHVGWAAAVAIVVITATRTRWRWLCLLYPLLTFAVVVATANHYWLDGAVVLVLLGAILRVVPRLRRTLLGNRTLHLWPKAEEPQAISRRPPMQVLMQVVHPSWWTAPSATLERSGRRHCVGAVRRYLNGGLWPAACPGRSPEMESPPPRAHREVVDHDAPLVHERRPVDYTDLVAGQREYFHSGATRPVEWRRRQLEAMKALLADNRDRFFATLHQDLRRNDVDSDLMDVGFCIKESEYALKHLQHWMKAEREPTPLMLRPGQIRVRRDPLGVTLIIGPWNEPLMLTFGPLAPALAAGNTAVIKPSELCVATSALIAELVPQYMDTNAIAVVEGAVPETTALLDQHWDLIFFTGSPQVGRIIHQAAAKHLTPAVLELGGKSPTIVHSSADIKTAARRIAHGRFSNAGQICTAPDHVLVWPEVKDALVAHLVEAVHDFYGDDPQQSLDYGRIINREATERLARLQDCGTAVVGGRADLDDLYIAPTVLVDVAWDSPIMQEEVFGPILPVLEIDSVQGAINKVNGNPHPLGLYIFAEDDDITDQILSRTGSGGAVVNDCTLQPLVPGLPFGGVGNSGMGKYHGRWGFEAFTNARGILYHSPRIDPGVRYPPYSEHRRLRALRSKLP